MLSIKELTVYICDTIKGNESHIGNIQFWFFKINHLSIKSATFWSKPHLNRTYGCRDMNNSVKFKNNVKNKNLSPLLACNSKSIFSTSNSLPFIMSYILFWIYHCRFWIMDLIIYKRESQSESDMISCRSERGKRKTTYDKNEQTNPDHQVGLFGPRLTSLNQG